MCGRPAVVMTDVCPCPRVSPSPCLSSTQVHVGVTPAELSPPIYCFLVALPAPPPQSSPVTSRPIWVYPYWLNIPSSSSPAGPPPPLSPNHHYHMLWPTSLPPPPLSPHSFPHPVSFLFLPLLYCNSHLALFAIHILIPRRITACTCSTLSSCKIYHIPSLHDFVSQDISHRRRLASLSVCSL